MNKHAVLRHGSLVFFFSGGVFFAQEQQPRKEQLPPAVRATAITGPYSPITGKQRATWFAGSTVGFKSLGAGILSAGWSTAWNNPEEYGPTWEGFGKRYGMRLTGVATSNAIEAGLGAAWGEDPRYVRAPAGTPFWGRVGHSVRLTFIAYRPDGATAPAYARMTGVVGGNFLSSTWRVESDSSASDALIRSAWGIGGRMAANVFDEFWPDLRRRIFGRKDSVPRAAGSGR